MEVTEKASWALATLEDIGFGKYLLSYILMMTLTYRFPSCFLWACFTCNAPIRKMFLTRSFFGNTIKKDRHGFVMFEVTFFLNIDSLD
jgi:hypothetical protein